jgi:hypothetical protein
MKQKEFVEVSWQKIIGGVQKAHEPAQIECQKQSDCDLANLKVKVMCCSSYAPKVKYFAKQGRNLIHFILFDVAVMCNLGADAKGSFFKLADIVFNTRGSDSVINIFASRIKFEAPFAFPQSVDIEL